MIKPDNVLLIFAFIVCWSAFALYAERKWKWASKISALGIAIVGSLALVNFNILPTISPSYDLVYDYILPLAIPLLLLQANIKKIYKESGKSFLIFHIAAIGSFIGAVLAGFLLFRNNPNIAGIVAMEVGAGTGGSINQVAMAESFGLSPDFIGAAVIAGNLLVLVYLMIVAAIPNIKFFKDNYPHPYMDEVEEGSIKQSKKEEVKAFTAINAGKLFGSALAIFAISTMISNFIGTLNVPTLVVQIGGNIYLVLTIVTVLLVTLFPKFFSNISGSQEMGTLMLMMFFTTLGAGAKIADVIRLAPIIFVIEAIMMTVNLVFTLTVGKIMKLNLEELLICSNAAYGGPSTAVGLAITKGWSKLAVPAVLVGVYGYVIGNLLGLVAGNLF